MVRRLQLQTILETTLGSRNVYFQPPENIKLQYPCIIYARNSSDTYFADDNPYVIRKKYKATLIDKNPDSPIIQKIAVLPMCSFDRHFTKDNLNHDVYNIVY